MIHDYYLYHARYYKDTELAQKKKKVLNKLNESKIIDEFYPNQEDLQNLPENSALIKVSFTLKKPYTSKDEGEFYLLEWIEKKTHQKIIENPIVRDKFTGLPMVRPSTWKGQLRFSAERTEGYNDKKKWIIIGRLFGSEPRQEDALKGRLYFFPTFFDDKAERDVVTPLKRDTRTPTTRGPIPIEVMKPGRKGTFYLLYLPYPKGRNFTRKQIKEDLNFLAEALGLMFYTYGFSAKKTSGFGVIEENLNEGNIGVKGGITLKNFSTLNELNDIIDNLGLKQ